MEQNIFEFVRNFVALLYEALPFIILGALVAGLLEELLPQELVARFIPRHRTFLAIGIGGFLGICFPMCECGIIPVMRRLLRKGVPLSACVCYMLAGPIINVIVMISTWQAFKGLEATSSATGFVQFGSQPMMPMRMILGYIVAFGTSVIVEWQYRKHGYKLLAPSTIPTEIAAANSPGGESTPQPRRSVWRRLENISETALHDFIDVTLFLIIGAVLASISRFFISPDTTRQIAANFPPVLVGVISVSIMMGLAIVLCICSEADAFVAASYTSMPAASKVAFLVLGPMLDLKLYMMYTRVFRPRLIWTIIGSVVVQVLVYATILHYILETFLSPTGSPGS